MQKVLILGGDGMLGQMVWYVLSKVDGLTTFRTSRKEAKPGSLFLDAERGYDGLHRLIESHGSFHYCINCAGILQSLIHQEDSASVRRALLVNAMFPHILAEVVSEFKVRIIHVSTDGVFPTNAGVCFEDTPAVCEDIYGKTKSLGEVISPLVVNIRCSIIGPDQEKGRGLLEWFLSSASASEVHGYTNHIWHGVTTLQFAHLCRQLICRNKFDTIRAQSAVHHFCPNPPISKYELLRLLAVAFRSGATITPVTGPGPPVCRILESRFTGLKEIYLNAVPMQNVLEDLALETRNLKREYG